MKVGDRVEIVAPTSSAIFPVGKRGVVIAVGKKCRDIPEFETYKTVPGQFIVEWEDEWSVATNRTTKTTQLNETPGEFGVFVAKIDDWEDLLERVE